MGSMSQLQNILNEAWFAQANRAFERYLDEHSSIDPVAAERMKAAFIEGFTAAGRPPIDSVPGQSPVLPMQIDEVIQFARLMLPFVSAFGKHGCITPNDMMVSLGIITATIGRGVHPSMSNALVYEVFSREMAVVMTALDKMQSSEGQVIQ